MFLKTYFIGLIPIVLCCFSSSAQNQGPSNIELHWGIEYTTPMNYYDSGIIGNTQKGFSHGKSYLFYMDSDKNLNLRPEEPPAMHIHDIGGFLRVVEINNANGELKKASLFNRKEIKRVITPVDLKEVAPGELIVRGRIHSRTAELLSIKIK